MTDSGEKSLSDSTKSSSKWRMQFWILCAMLLLALGGMGVSEAAENWAWQYWLLVVVVYGALGIWRSVRRAKQKGQSVRKLFVRELAHWVTLLAFLCVVLLLQRQEIVSGQAASDVMLLLLALSCCLAGVHFDWLLLCVGVVLTVMLVAMAMLEQYTVLLWLVVIVVAIGAAAFFYFRSLSADSVSKTSK